MLPTQTKKKTALNFLEMLFHISASFHVEAKPFLAFHDTKPSSLMSCARNAIFSTLFRHAVAIFNPAFSLQLMTSSFADVCYLDIICINHHSVWFITTSFTIIHSPISVSFGTIFKGTGRIISFRVKPMRNTISTVGHVKAVKAKYLHKSGYLYGNIIPEMLTTW